MAVVAIDITISLVSYKAWLTTSYIASALIGDDGTPLITNNELGPDQEDYFKNIIEQASREVLKSFVTRQGDVSGVPFFYDGTNAIYRFNECEPVLTQADALKSELTEDVKNALFTYVTMKWFALKGNEKHTALFMAEFESLQNSIQGILHRLHD